MPDEREIHVVAHAIHRMRQRCHDDRSDDELREEIVREVRAALDAGRIRNHKINGFILYRERRGPFKDVRDRFVWAEDEGMAWLIRRLPGQDLVMTTLSRAGVRR